MAAAGGAQTDGEHSEVHEALLQPEEAEEALDGRRRRSVDAFTRSRDSVDDLDLLEEGDIVKEDRHNVEAPGAFLWALTMSAGVSGLLFGYDTGVISSTLVSIDLDLSCRALTTLDKSLITSATSLFALLASPIAGTLADTLGRKPVVLLAGLLFIIGALWQSFATTVSAMICGRSVVGLAVGAASFVVPLYIAELAPAQLRGRLVTVQSLLITGGQVIAYLAGWGLSTLPHGWRWMVGLGAAPAAVQVALLGYMPETPRWLVQAGKKEKARSVLKRVYGKAEGAERAVEGVLRAVEREVLEEEEVAVGAGGNRKASTSWTKLKQTWRELKLDGGNRRALIIACMLQGFQQLCGFNSLMYFSATIFALVGFGSPILTSLSIALTNFLFTVVAFHAIDRIGRRRILLLSIPVMVAGLALCSVAFNFIKLPMDGQKQEQVGQGSKAWPLVILGAMVIYVAGYAVGLGCVPWQQSELFPLPVRSLGSALATATNWGSNFLIGLSFLPMMDILTPVGTFALYTSICVIGFFCVKKIYPETAGLSLEEVGQLLKEGWGVRNTDVRGGSSSAAAAAGGAYSVIGGGEGEEERLRRRRLE